MAIVKTVRFQRRAQRAMLRHAADAQRIAAKVLAYAADPQSQANNVKRLKGGRSMFRLRVGGFRVIFVDEGDTIVVTDVGPPGSIYD
jgi:mRNA interferase RelE/StbE